VHPVFQFIGLFFLLGFVGTMLANRRTSDAEKCRERWLKFWVYVIIVLSIVGILLWQPVFFVAISGLILGGGGYELLFVGRRAELFSRKKGLFGLVLSVFLVNSGLFLFFSIHSRPEHILFIYFIVVVFDGFSQVVGQLIGRTPFAPKTSPNKTIEGSVGGFLVAVFAGFQSASWANISEKQAVFATVAICFFALAGDLMASRFKRLAGVKDYSHLIPGHGGVLDRFDSLIVAGAAAGVFELIFC
jgi:phosphatidate cytidylyltransferase